MFDNRAIGVFDSGIGGLTVVKNLIDILPNENIIYFGDIARIPYGTKSQATIEKFAVQTAKFLVNQKVKAIIIACNTVSAIAKNIVQEIAGDIPVIDVISSSVDLVSNLNNIGVIATPATINSNAYTLEINKINPDSNVYAKDCGLFVPMIEEGFVKGEVVDLVVKEYLEYFLDKPLDALILGCTHYPIIKDCISKMLKGLYLVDPSLRVIHKLEELLHKENLLNKNLLNKEAKSPKYKFYVTDIPIKFKLIGEMFLKIQMQHLEIINLESLNLY